MSIEKRALSARETYWSTIDHLDRATETPSQDSLRGWMEVIRDIERTADALGNARRGVEQGDHYGFVSAAAYASIAAAEAIEKVADRLQPQPLHVDFADLSHRANEWWIEGRGGSGQRMEYVLERLLKELGVTY